MRADAKPLAWPWVAAGTVSSLALAAGLLVLAAREGGSSWFFYLSDAAFPLVWTLTGLAAWRLRPRSHSGRLMVLLGCALFVNAPFGWQLPPDLPLREVFTALGAAGYWFALTLAAHLMVTYPTGRTETAAERALLRTIYPSAAVVTLTQLLLMTVDEAACGDRCQVSPIAVVDDRGIFVGAMTVAQIWFAGLAVAVLVLMVLRFRRAGPRWHGQRMVLLIACVVVVVGTGLQFVLTAAIGSAAARPDLFYVPAWLVVVAVPSAFLVGLLRDRVSYGSVADLVAGLDQVRPDDLQAALAATLQDPRLRILFPVGTEGDYVDPDGQWVELPDDPSLALTPLGDRAAPVAVLLHDRTLSDNPKLLAGAGGAARLALDNARLQAEVKAQLAEVRASRARIVAAADEERRRLERDLHDGAQQRLLGIGMSLQMLRETSRGAEPEGLVELEAEVRSAIAELRDLAQGIRPAVLTDEGLVAAVGLLARRCPVPVSVDADVSQRPPADIEATAYYVVSEALQNVAKHARASAALVTLRRDQDWLEVRVSDDGVGGASLETGSGLRGLLDRAVAVDGNLRVTCPPAGGTVLEARLPCA